jgi:oxygen-dependent protoporphyrinogen oxidase
MKPVAIIGAGITGLTAAYELKRRGIAVRVFEAGPEAGGVIRSIRRDGFLAECGPNTLLETSPVIPELITELGLKEEMLYSNAEAKNRYVIREGKLVAVPSSVFEFATTKLFTSAAKLHLLWEPFVSRSNPEIEESLGQFVVRRLGHEFLDYAINPFVAGVYAGDPWKLSVKEAFGKVYDLEQKYGSLIKGQVLGARDRKQRGTVSKQNAAKISFKEGLQTLPKTLAEKLGPEMHYDCSLCAMEQKADGWELEFNTFITNNRQEFSAVLVTLPAYKLAEMEFRSLKQVEVGFLEKIEYARVSSLALGFRREQVQHPLDGFGFLVPEVEGLNILGGIFNSSLFPGRAPNDSVMISCFLGGLRAPTLATVETGELLKIAMKDLRQILGISGEPSFIHHSLNLKGIPQYELGYAQIREQIREVEENCRGLFLGGNYREGVSLSDSILNGLTYGKRMAEFLGSKGSSAGVEQQERVAA